MLISEDIKRWTPPILTPIPMSFFHTTKQFSDTSWVFHNSAQLRHWLPKNQMLSPTRLPPSDTNHKSGLSPKLLTNPLNYRWEDSTTSSSGSINLAEQLTRLRETFYFLAYWFIIKGYNSGIVRKRGTQGKACGKWWGVSMPSKHTSHQISMWSKQGVLQIPFFWIFREALLIKSVTISDWT